MTDETINLAGQLQTTISLIDGDINHLVVDLRNMVSLQAKLLTILIPDKPVIPEEKTP